MGNSDATIDQKPDSGDNKDPNPTPNPDTGDNKDPESTPDSFASPTAASIYSGTPDISWYTGNQSEYVLTTADQLAGLNKLRQDNKGALTFKGVTIKLGADIVINEGTLEEVKARGAANKTLFVTGSDMPFMGIFDGQGHSISGVYNSTGYNYRGIFGTVGGNAQIKNFVLENSYFTGSTEAPKNYFGTIIGLINDSKANVTLSNIIVSSTVLMEQSTYTMSYVGGFVGGMSAGKLTLNNCHFNGKIYFPDSEFIGGFVGRAVSGTTVTFNNCHGTGSVTCKNYVAGLAVVDMTTTNNKTQKTNNGSCLTGSIAVTTTASNKFKNASYIRDVAS